MLISHFVLTRNRFYRSFILEVSDESMKGHHAFLLFERYFNGPEEKVKHQQNNSGVFGLLDISKNSHELCKKVPSVQVPPPPPHRELCKCLSCEYTLGTLEAM